jgi:hypothetical protein
LNRAVAIGIGIAIIVVVVGFVMWDVVGTTSKSDLIHKYAMGEISQRTYCDELDRNGWMTMADEVSCKAIYSR